MYDFRNEYREKKPKGNGWVISLTCFSVVALIFSSVALYRSNQLVNSGRQSTGVDIKVATTAVQTTNGSEISSNSSGVVDVADAMKNKVAYISVYGQTSGTFSNSVQYAQISNGSGFVVSGDGYVVTNYHVIENGSSYKITLNTEEYDASVVGYDLYSDIAVLKINNADKQFDAVVLGDSNTIKVGEMAIAIGSPLGAKLNNSVTVGYISALEREITSNSHTLTMIQTDAAINPGNSGGPLLNSSGQVIGINTMKSTIAGYDDYGNTISTDGISFAIPISDALPIITEIIETGKYQRPGIGITYYTIDSETSRRNNISQGLLIRNVLSDSPASNAGLQVDDIITAIDGKEIKSATDLNNVLDTKKVGDKITITVNRKGNNVDVELTLGELSETTTSTQNQNKGNKGSWSWPC